MAKKYKRKTKDTYIGKPSIPSSRAKMLLQSKLRDLTIKYVIPANKVIKEMIKNEFPIDEIIKRISEMDKFTQTQYDSNIKGIIKRWAYEVSSTNKKIIENTVAKAIGVDSVTLLDNKSVKEVINSFEETSVSLIKSIPRENFSKVTDAIIRNYSGVPQPGEVSLAQRISDIGNISLKRGKFIARDQTATLNGLVNSKRCEETGITSYVWSTSKDERVVGNPSGLFPNPTKAHGNHYERDNKIFKWSKPPRDGHPGIAINCRCVGKPYVDIPELKNIIYT